MGILQDILREDLTVDDKRILVRNVFDGNFSEGLSKSNLGRSKTLGNAKSLLEFYELVHQSIQNYEMRAGTTDENKVIFTEEEPDAGCEPTTDHLSLDGGGLQGFLHGS